MSVLHEAAAHGDREHVEDILKQNRYDKNERDEDWDGRTPLSWAVINGHLSCVKTLLNAGANPCTRNNDKKSLAHYAAESGRADILKELIDGGCEVTEPDMFGDTAFDYTLIYNNLECGELLAKIHNGEYTPRVNPMIWLSSRRGSSIPAILSKYAKKASLVTAHPHESHRKSSARSRRKRQ